MSIAILGGFAKGFALKVVSSAGLRPTSVILRRKIFDRYQDLSGMYFVDACAGTGAMGLEACSRGAEKVTFVEANKKYFQILKENVSRFQSKSKNEQTRQLKVTLAKVQSWLSHFKQDYVNLSVDQRANYIFFFDPPYHLKDLYKKVIEEQLVAGQWYEGQIWVESDRLKGVPKEYWDDKGLTIKAIYEHSDSYLLIIENSL